MYGWRLGPWRELQVFEELADGLLRAERTGYPAVNIKKSEEDAVLTAELPGLDPKEIDISIKGRTVTIQGSRKPEGTGEKATYLRRERWSGKFQRRIELPFHVEPGKVAAKYKRGVLSVRLPRAEAEKPRKITVSLN
jgi:HSP20 family protein